MPVLLLIIILAFSNLAGAQEYLENEYWLQFYRDDPPIITDLVPDSNFTRLSYALPNNPKCELIHDNHLYLGCGTILRIYELNGGNEPVLTGEAQTYDFIWDLDHDGDYVYVANGYRGITIFEGDNYANPAEISHIQTGNVCKKICVSGDSLYYFIAYQLGIMNIADRANPYIEREVPQDSINIIETFGNNIYKYHNYLIFYVQRRNPAPKDYLGVFDLGTQSGIPALVDSIRIYAYYGAITGIRLKENRLYLLTGLYLFIYELDGNVHPEQRCQIYIGGGRRYPDIAGFDEAILNGSRIGFFGIKEYVVSLESTFTTIYSLSLDDLSNPVFIDSTERLYNVLFTDLIQDGYYSFTVTSPFYFYNPPRLPGVYHYEWTPDLSGELIGRYTQYSLCVSVAARDNVVYAGTVYEGVPILDMTDKTNPRLAGSIANVPFIIQMKIIGNRLYLLGVLKLIIYDITDPFAPVELGRLNLQPGSCALNFNIRDNLVYLSYFFIYPTGQGWLLIADVTDPANIITYYNEYIIWSQSPSYLDYPRLYLLSNTNMLYSIYNVSNPYEPYRYITVNVDGGIASCLTINNYLYLFGALDEIWDVSSAYQPFRLTSVWGYGFNDVQLVDGKLFMADFLDDGIYVWDVESSPLERRDIAYYNGRVFSFYAIDYPYVYLPGSEYGLITLRFDDPTRIKEEDQQLPLSSKIISAYPNPFNSSVTFSVNANADNNSELGIYDIAGRLVRTLEINGANSENTNIHWDGKNSAGVDASSGIYFARYDNQDISETIKVVLLR